MNKLKELRREKGLTQREIACIVGCSKSAISLYESGRQQPSMNMAHKIAKVLEVTINDLFFPELDPGKERSG